MTIAEISECFPNNFKPVTGEFIFQHAKSLSRHCRVIAIIPLRLVPSKELFSWNPVKLFSNLYAWFCKIMETKDFEIENLKVIYFKYASLPRPFFEIADNHFIKIFFYGRLKKILKSYNVDLIYCNWLRPWGVVSSKLSKYFRIPLVLDHHEDIATLKKLFPSNYERFLKICNKADKVIVHSSAAVEEIKHEINTKILKPVEIKKIYYGQSFKCENIRKSFNGKSFNIICISHLTEDRKNIDCLIKALDLIQANKQLNFNLQIVGDGNLKKDYEKLVTILSLNSRVKFLGRKSQKDVETILQSSDILVLPSYPEAFGIVLLEALSKGVPVITCRGNGGGEELKILKYPVTLVEPFSPLELARSVIELSGDRNKMLLMSEQGKLLINQYFTWDKNAESTYAFLKQTISNFNEHTYVRN